MGGGVTHFGFWASVKQSRVGEKRQAQGGKVGGGGKAGGGRDLRRGTISLGGGGDYLLCPPPYVDNETTEQSRFGV